MTQASKTMSKQQCFEQLLLGKAVKSEAWLDKIRLEALVHAEVMSFPSARHDDWRFTDLSSLFSHSFQPITSFARLTLGDVDKFLIPGSIRVVFVDGCYAAELSDLTQAGSGVTVASLAERLGDKAVAANFGRHAPYKQDAFVALNTNFFEDGAWVHVATDAAVPIHLLHVATKRETASAIYPRCMVVMESSSHATIVEDYVGIDDGIYFSNAVTEVVLKDHAQLHHVRVQREQKNAFHIGHCSVAAGRNSVYSATSVALGARACRAIPCMSRSRARALKCISTAWL